MAQPLSQTPKHQLVTTLLDDQGKFPYHDAVALTRALAHTAVDTYTYSFDPNHFNFERLRVSNQ